jgi:hypothetical protein|tara:strand:+ start:119 stop:1609 length:1491 start_codon:yes stop_codon:yes gene_type:complete
MIIHNYFVKFIKEIYFTINRLIKNNLNKLSSANFYKISKSNKFFLLLITLIVLFLTYLLIPNIYDKVDISKKLNAQLQKKFNLNFNLSQNLKYNFFPRPHFIYKNSSISQDKNKISKIEKLKIYISLNNLFLYRNLEIQNLILEKSNFNLNNQNYDFFIKLLDSDLKDDQLIIKDSNIFYKNKNDEVLFINKILDMKYFYDIKNMQNKVVSKNKIFNLPYSIELNQNNIEKKIFSKLNLNFLKLRIDNELDFSEEVKNGFINYSINKDKFNGTYNISKNNFIFNLFDNFENSNIFYKGNVNFSPFYSKLKGTIKEINILHLLNSNSLILQLLKTEILNNKNLNIDLNVYADKSKNFSDFIKIHLNSNIKEGLIDINNTRFSWKDAVDFFLEDSLIYVKESELILDAKLNLTIKNSDEIYKFLQTPKNYRNDFKSIKINFAYNFDQKIAYLDNIVIDNNNNKDVNKILESLIFKKNKLQNRVYLKNILNKAIKFYAG